MRPHLSVSQGAFSALPLSCMMSCSTSCVKHVKGENELMWGCEDPSLDLAVIYLHISCFFWLLSFLL
ncbi:hypothetical protein DUNSADRAFT_11386 [Dunaliella salina]|uniref:Encoded protein n=1 Tax=Dunaliella salina TaxID=3046 RepID=A0ABQ7GDP4_DUNSA|nr:hypothetical protein DUNSADRAFT_11386 [Dunaliella salina]|eukprot:KAF5832678.1 hypothetical protein DUNSADRAFT_11386 [Dunaliella salina]